MFNMRTIRLMCVKPSGFVKRFQTNPIFRVNWVVFKWQNRQVCCKSFEDAAGWWLDYLVIWRENHCEISECL